MKKIETNEQQNKLLTLLHDPRYRTKGWNGYEAAPISEETIGAATKLLSVIGSGAPFVSPTGRDSIQFEWENDDGYFEIEIFKNGHIITYCELGESHEED